MKAATAEIWNATEPARFSAAIHHRVVQRLPDGRIRWTAWNARRLAIMNATEPHMSGAQTSRCCCGVSRREISALNVLMLKSRVPMDCTAAAHQSIERSSNPDRRQGRPGSALRLSTTCR
jgi:hypothetical protein